MARRRVSSLGIRLWSHCRMRSAGRPSARPTEANGRVPSRIGQYAPQRPSLTRDAHVTDDTARHLRYTSRAKREADVSLRTVAPWSTTMRRVFHPETNGVKASPHRHKRVLSHGAPADPSDPWNSHAAPVSPRQNGDREPNAHPLQRACSMPRATGRTLALLPSGGGVNGGDASDEFFDLTGWS